MCPSLEARKKLKFILLQEKILVDHLLVLLPAVINPSMDNLTSKMPTIAPVGILVYIQTRSEFSKYLFLLFLLSTTAAGSLRLYVRSRLVRIFGADNIFLLATMVRASRLLSIQSNRTDMFRNVRRIWIVQHPLRRG